MGKVIPREDYFKHSNLKSRKDALIIIKTNQIVYISWNPKNKKHYVNKGYQFTRYGDKIAVRVEDVAKTSKSRILVICDICRVQEYEISVYASNKSSGKHVCNDCNKIKNKITCTCSICNRGFISTKTQLNKSKSGKLFCSNKCVGVYNSRTKNKQILKKCSICKKDYKVKKCHEDTNVTCSIKCQNEWQSKYLRGSNANNYKGGNRNKSCLNCENFFYAGTPSEYKSRKFCSLKCKHSYWETHTLHSEDFNNKRYIGSMRYRKTLGKNRKETKPELMVREYFQSIGLVKGIDFFQEEPFFWKILCGFLSTRLQISR